MTLFAAGAELQHLYPVSIAAHGLGLNITVSSYRDELDFGLIAAANLIPDVTVITRLLPAILEELEIAVGIATTAVVAPISDSIRTSIMKPRPRVKRNRF